MGLPWVRLDVGFSRNPKMLALLHEKDGYHAAFVWVVSLTYAGEQGSDGYIPESALHVLHARKRDACLLVEHRFWHSATGGGWVINGWDDYQQSNSETQERARRLREGAVKGNCIRWHGPDCGCWKEVAL